MGEHLHKQFLRLHAHSDFWKAQVGLFEHSKQTGDDGKFYIPTTLSFQ